jgi:hypothetical protein
VPFPSSPSSARAPTASNALQSRLFISQQSQRPPAHPHYNPTAAPAAIATRIHISVSTSTEPPTFPRRGPRTVRPLTLLARYLLPPRDLPGRGLFHQRPNPKISQRTAPLACTYISAYLSPTAPRLPPFHHPGPPNARCGLRRLPVEPRTAPTPRAFRDARSSYRLCIAGAAFRSGSGSLGRQTACYALLPRSTPLGSRREKRAL